MVLSMDRWIGKVAVVTGASSGIGAAIAEKLVEQGLKVAAIARRKERLDDMAKRFAAKKGRLYPVRADMSNESDILKAFKYIRENIGPVHILVNNAGRTAKNFQLLSDGDAEVWEDMFRVNVIGLSIATREAIKDMKANNVDGHIIHINSSLGHRLISMPGLNVYPATKFAVTALAETLRLELNSLKSKIKITSLSPGLVETELLSPAMKENVKGYYAENKIIEPENIADAVVYALSTPPHVQIQELTVRPLASAHN